VRDRQTDRVMRRVRKRTVSWLFEAATKGPVTALFLGPDFEAQAAAAAALANRLDVALYRVDLSMVVSEYIGETEKRLREAFDAAEQGGALLLFDEADALFGKRSEVRDSHDRYANVAVNFFLQRLEVFDGVAIVMLNRDLKCDDKWARRLGCVVRFPPRRRSWRVFQG
jgi:SpoVK/Ycf46/Vps4 family AAA+-type ATPase